MDLSKRLQILIEKSTSESLIRPEEKLFKEVYELINSRADM